MDYLSDNSLIVGTLPSCGVPLRGPQKLLHGHRLHEKVTFFFLAHSVGYGGIDLLALITSTADLPNDIIYLCSLLTAH